ncbi:hypothetical protein N0V90_006974 [Kalmusia sp. IMI 367209]|nr:hypothetical protein N0V90_006974 [Kalmusia sp. IMI 367209]
MDKIFANALFTIAAVSSPNGTVPFLGPSAPNQRGEYQSVDICDPLDPTRVAKARRQSPLLLPLFVSGPLEERAWAWQEHYLSVRIVHLDENEARWECQEAQGCECIGALACRGAKSYRNVDPVYWDAQWQEIIGSYSRRLLTYPTDRLPALAGVASRFSEVAETEYLAGLWRSQFPYALAWYAREPSDCPTGRAVMWHSLNNKVPSWSWASVQNEAWWTWALLFGAGIRRNRGAALKAEAELVGSDCRPSTENPFGEVQEGSYIELRGRVVEAEMEVDRYGCACVRRDGFGAQLVQADCDIVADKPKTSWGERAREKLGIPGKKIDMRSSLLRRATGEDYFQRNDDHAKGPVLCLLLASLELEGKKHACVLILGPIADNETEYCRLGIASGNHDQSIYSRRKYWERWQGWDELEEWDDWERWFEGGDIRIIRVV